MNKLTQISSFLFCPSGDSYAFLGYRGAGRKLCAPFSPLEPSPASCKPNPAALRKGTETSAERTRRKPSEPTTSQGGLWARLQPPCFWGLGKEQLVAFLA